MHEDVDVRGDQQAISARLMDPGQHRVDDRVERLVVDEVEAEEALGAQTVGPSSAYRPRRMILVRVVSVTARAALDARRRIVFRVRPALAPLTEESPCVHENGEYGSSFNPQLPQRGGPRALEELPGSGGVEPCGRRRDAA